MRSCERVSGAAYRETAWGAIYTLRQPGITSHGGRPACVLVGLHCRCCGDKHQHVGLRTGRIRSQVALSQGASLEGKRSRRGWGGRCEPPRLRASDAIRSRGNEAAWKGARSSYPVSAEEGAFILGRLHRPVLYHTRTCPALVCQWQERLRRRAAHLHNLSTPAMQRRRGLPSGAGRFTDVRGYIGGRTTIYSGTGARAGGSMRTATAAMAWPTSWLQ